MRFTPAGDVLAAGHYGVKLLDAVTGEEKRVFRDGPLCSEAGGNENYVLAAFRDNRTRLWDARGRGWPISSRARRLPSRVGSGARGR